MAKTLIFLRGPKTDRRIALAIDLRGVLVDSTWIAMDEVDPDPKRAHAACMQATKNALTQGRSSQIVIDNESLLPIHWQAYYSIAERNAVSVSVIGVDIYEDADSPGKNLQLKNLPMFIASVDKYLCVKTDADLADVKTWFLGLKGD